MAVGLFWPKSKNFLLAPNFFLPYHQISQSMGMLFNVLALESHKIAFWPLKTVLDAKKQNYYFWKNQKIYISIQWVSIYSCTSKAAAIPKKTKHFRTLKNSFGRKKEHNDEFRNNIFKYPAGAYIPKINHETPKMPPFPRKNVFLP